MCVKDTWTYEDNTTYGSTVCDLFEDPVVYGCTDPEAMNYNPNATANDNSCY